MRQQVEVRETRSSVETGPLVADNDLVPFARRSGDSPIVASPVSDLDLERLAMIASMHQPDQAQAGADAVAALLFKGLIDEELERLAVAGIDHRVHAPDSAATSLDQQAFEHLPAKPLAPVPGGDHEGQLGNPVRPTVQPTKAQHDAPHNPDPGQDSTVGDHAARPDPPGETRGQRQGRLLQPRLDHRRVTLAERTQGQVLVGRHAAGPGS